MGGLKVHGQKRKYHEYPLRACRGKGEVKICRECHKAITIGQTYFDGGKYRRCHFLCAPPVKDKKP